MNIKDKLLSWLGYGHVKKERIENLLKVIYSMENNQVPLSVEYLSGKTGRKPEKVLSLLKSMVEEGLLESFTGPLTPKGKEYALKIIRNHRLYEKYLAENSGFEPSEWHPQACKKEHHITDDEQKKISETLGNPLFDPHGDPIPSETGEYIKVELCPLCQAKEGAIVKVLRVEDFPESVIKQIQEIGLLPGSVFKVLSICNDGMKILYEGEEYELSCEVVHNIKVDNSFNIKGEEWMIDCERLYKLKPGEEALILGLSPACRGVVRRRLLDLGFVAGSRISIDLVSPMGNPTAYVVRGTAIALRHDQARYVLIKK